MAHETPIKYSNKVADAPDYSSTIHPICKARLIYLCKKIDEIVQRSHPLSGSLDLETLMKSDDQEKTLKSFLSKRIKGAIRRAVDMNRGEIRIPEHKLNEIRKDFGEDKKAGKRIYRVTVLLRLIPKEEPL